MKLKELIEPLEEANLSGKSRSGGDTNWNTYIVQDFNPKKEYTLEVDTDLIDPTTKDTILKLQKNDVINILSTTIKKVGNSQYANVKVKKTNDVGYVRISSIRKPTTKLSGIIPGGKNSKEFTPDKLNLIGVKFNSSSTLVNTIVNNIKSVYGESEYKQIREYLYRCMESVGGTSITEGFNKTYSIKKDFNLDMGDVKILSKNFGEVLAALYILHTNKKSKYVEFPADISQGLYDFISVGTNDKTYYYSVKSHGGSSTSMENLNYILKNFSKDNIIFKKYRREVSAIMSLINNKKEGKTTLTNIENFFNTILNQKQQDIIRELNKISTYSLQNLSQKELSKWFNSMVTKVSVDDFVQTMNNVYNNVLSDAGSTPKTTEKVLREIYEMGNADKVQHGYIYYPMGSYIVNYMNNDTSFVMVLNTILNYGALIVQFNVNMSQNEFEIQIKKFKESTFRFSYNGGSKYPANRPIGFIKA